MGKLIRFRRKGKAADPAARTLFQPGAAGASDARPGAFASDAATHDSIPKPGAAPDPVIQKKKTRRRRSVIALLVVLFLAGSAAALFGDRGYVDVQRQRRHLAELRASNEVRQQHVDALKRDIERLKTDPAAVERIAREDLGYAAPGEVTLLLPEDDPPEPSGLDAKPGSAIVPDVKHAH